MKRCKEGISVDNESDRFREVVGIYKISLIYQYFSNHIYKTTDVYIINNNVRCRDARYRKIFS